MKLDHLANVLRELKTNSEQTHEFMTETDDGDFPGGAGEVVERDSLGHHFGGSHVEY